MRKYNLLMVFLCTILLTFFGLANEGSAHEKDQNVRETVKVLFEEFFIKSNGVEMVSETPMIIYKGESYVPLREVVQSIDKEILWSQATRTVYINDLHQDRIDKDKLFSDKLPNNSQNEYLTFEEEILAEGSIVIEGETQQVMFEKNAFSKFYPASTVKIMTALLALEHGDLNENVTVAEEVSNIPHDSSRAHIKPGDVLTLEQLIYGMFLPSGNDCAVAIAIHIGGTEENFANMMNEKAKELGARKTNFVNAHGYHHSDQYTTPYDLALIAYEANQNPQFVKIMKTPHYKAEYKNKHGEPAVRHWRHTNRFLRADSGFSYKGIIGGKTGFTTPAGHNLVTFAHHNDRDYIVVILKGGAQARYTDTQSLLRNAYATRKQFNDRFKEEIQIAAPHYDIFLNGKKIESNEKTFTYNGRSYVPLNFINLLTDGKSDIEVTNPQLKLLVNNKIISFNESSQIPVTDRTLLAPARLLLKGLDYHVKWDQQIQSVIAFKPDSHLYMNVGSKTILVNNQPTSLETPIIVKEGQAYIPVRSFTKRLNTQFGWGRARTVKIDSASRFLALNK